MTSSQAASVMAIYPTVLAEPRPANPAPAAPVAFRIEGEVETHWLVERYFLPSCGYGASALAKSIERQGAIEPVTLYEGRLLDGRIRDQASRELGKPREAIRFEDTPQGIIAAQARSKEAMDRAALEYAIAKNLARRHYRDSQRAALAFRLADMPQGARNDLEHSAGLRKVSQPEAAEVCGVSVRSVQNAGRIYRDGLPADVADMEAGKHPLEQIVQAIKWRERARKTSVPPRILYPFDKPNTARLICGDALTELRKFPDNSFDACICDPPYGMKMDKWDAEIPPLEHWAEGFRVLKPGAWCLGFGCPQLYHRLATFIEQAGFLVQDMGEWIITTKMAKTNRLKPAHEPICIAQKPYEQCLDYNEKRWGVGYINVEDARIPWDKEPPTSWVAGGVTRRTFGREGNIKGSRAMFGTQDANPNGRYPSNVIGYLDEDRLKFFYAPRVTVGEKGYYNNHPTTKPIDLMKWLIGIFAPRGSMVLDPYMGSGSTGLAAVQQRRNFVGIEVDQANVDIARRRFEEQIAQGQWQGELLCQRGDERTNETIHGYAEEERT